MSGEEEEPQMKTEISVTDTEKSEFEKPTEEPSKETTVEVNKDANSNTEPPSESNENFVVLDTIVNEEDSIVEPEVSKEEKVEELKEEITLKDETEPLKDEPEGDSPVKTVNENATSEDVEMIDSSKDSKTSQSAEMNSSNTSSAKPAASTASANNSRVRKKPKAPVVDVNSLRKRKWQLKVYPLHAEDLQLSYVSILCKLASESLLYIPSEGRAGKAELYVATQKETAAIIGKLLRMEFYNQLLSIEVVRKDTGGKEEGDDSKKECKAFLMFDKHLSKKIFDARGEKGSAIEKSVTLNKLPKAATKDFVNALFPFATDTEIIENEDPAERKAVVKCKTPVTSLLVYKSFKRLEINDVHVKLSVDESVKAIRIPSMYFATPNDKKDMGPPDSLENLNRSSLPNRRPLMTPLNRRVQLIRRRALMTGLRKKPGLSSSRGPGPLLDEPSSRRPLLGSRLPEPRGIDLMRPLIGPSRRRLSERSDRRGRDRDSMERRSRRGDREDSLVTKEMMQLQTQLSQAIKNQIAMLNTAQSGAGPMVGPRGPMERGMDHFPPPVTPHRAPLLGQGPRGGFGDTLMPSNSRDSRGMNQHHGSDYTPSNAWSGDMSGARMDRDSRGGVSTSNDRQMERDRMVRGDRISDRSNRGPDRTSSGIRDGRDTSSSRRGIDSSNRMDRKTGGGGNAERSGRTGERSSRNSRDRSEKRRTSDVSRGSRASGRQPAAFGGSGGGGDGSSSRGNGKERHGGGGASLGLSSQGSRSGGHGDAGRQVRQTDFSSSRSSQRNDNTYTSNSHSQNSSSGRYGEYNNQSSGDGNSYYRRY